MRYQQQDNAFQHQIVAGDESWCYHYEPEFKHQYAVEVWTISEGKKKSVLFFDRKSNGDGIFYYQAVL